MDYLLVNIESAWHEMLRHGHWTKNVRCIKIEIQDHYDEAVPMLETLGYKASLQLLNWGAFATGIRPADPATGQALQPTQGMLPGAEHCCDPERVYPFPPDWAGRGPM